MFRFILTVISVLFIIHDGFTQKYKVKIQYTDITTNKNSDTIYYDTQNRLTWDDFRGKPDADYKVGAMTASGIGYNTRITSDGEYQTMNVNVFTFFLKSGSWKKPDVNDGSKLEHEQRHFDMTYLGALKFVDVLRNTKLTPKTFESQVHDKYLEVYSDTKEAQKQFDQLTSHGGDTRAQADWNRHIKEMIISALATEKLALSK